MRTGVRKLELIAFASLLLADVRATISFRHVPSSREPNPMRSEATRASFRVWQCLARLPSRFHVQQANRSCRSSCFAPYASRLLSERPCDLAGAGGTGWRRIGSDQCFPCSLFVHCSDCCLARFPRLALVDSEPPRRRGSSDFISLDLLRQVCIYIIEKILE